MKLEEPSLHSPLPQMKHSKRVVNTLTTPATCTSSFPLSHEVGYREKKDEMRGEVLIVMTSWWRGEEVLVQNCNQIPLFPLSITTFHVILPSFFTTLILHFFTLNSLQSMIS
jgi:hypothetical protein